MTLYDQLRAIPSPHTLAQTLNEAAQNIFVGFDRVHQHTMDGATVLLSFNIPLDAILEIDNFCNINYSGYKELSKDVLSGRHVPYRESDLEPIREIRRIVGCRLEFERAHMCGLVENLLEHLDLKERSTFTGVAFVQIKKIRTVYQRYDIPLELSQKHNDILFRAKLSIP